MYVVSHHHLYTHSMSVRRQNETRQSMNTVAYIRTPLSDPCFCKSWSKGAEIGTPNSEPQECSRNTMYRNIPTLALVFRYFCYMLEVTYLRFPIPFMEVLGPVCSWMKQRSLEPRLAARLQGRRHVVWPLNPAVVSRKMEYGLGTI